jgi:predicted chitinase
MAMTKPQAIAALMAEMIAQGITDVKMQAMLLGQCDHESKGFTKLEEGLRYKPERLMEISLSARKKGLAACQKACADGPAAVAEIMYGGRMGNRNPGDGYKYRGRGFIQLTGFDNYKAASKATGVDYINNPDLAMEPEGAAKLAVWFWKTYVGTKGANGNVKSATLAINGGTIGLEHRTQMYNEYLALVPTYKRVDNIA